MLGFKEVGASKRRFLVGDGELDLGAEDDGTGGVLDLDPAPPPPTVRRIEGPLDVLPGAVAFGGVGMFDY